VKFNVGDFYENLSTGSNFDYNRAKNVGNFTLRRVIVANDLNRYKIGPVE